MLLALGSNLAPRPAWLDLALDFLAEEGISVLSSTPQWNTSPIGPISQPDFLNQLLLVSGERRGLGWLELAKDAETRAGRLRQVTGGPRTLDVDVILIEGQRWDLPELTVPHPALLVRQYLLRGAAKLVPKWIHPIEGLSMAELARNRLVGDHRARAEADPPEPGWP